jgi:uncharacterized protein involved in response to NO
MTADLSRIMFIPAMTAKLEAVKNPRVKWRSFAREPFRIFFPLAVLAGIVGVALWPLHFLGVVPLYPGQAHARIMTYGLFGGFIAGFLGTAMPRMLSAKPFRRGEVIGLVLLHSALVGFLAFGKVAAGSVCLLLFILSFFACVAIRISARKDTPPPGFVLVGLAALCVTAGAVLSILQDYYELDAYWITVQRLLSSQGFVLLPILGIGPFILPRFFGMQSAHDFPEALVPGKDWWKKAAMALAAGVLIIVSFFIEAGGGYRLGHALRFVTTLVYLYLEMPFHRAPKAGNALGATIRVAFISLLAGFLAVAFFPEYRVSLLHLTLIGGFAMITFVVATRVVFGHSGNIHLLKKRNRWLLVSAGLMLFGMATRISGDFWPKVLISHYSYGAILWIAGVLVWSAFVLPKVLVTEDDE